MPLTPLRRWRDRIRARLGDSYKFYRALGVLCVLVIYTTAVFAIGHGSGYENGRSDAAIVAVHRVLHKLDQADCRAELAGPVNDAAVKQNSGLTVSLIAGLVARERPDIAARLQRQYPGRSLEQILSDNVDLALDQNGNLLRANAKRGRDPVAQCSDGKPGN
jgi:hypothetical protein